MNPGFARAATVAAYYRSIGLCPLPSRMDRKGPTLDAFAQHYGAEPVPESVYENWHTTNIQIITGTKSPTPTKIIVVDCDGEEAKEQWRNIKAYHCYTETNPWIAITGSGNGSHTYFRLHPQVSALSSGLIWGLWDTWGNNGKGKWTPHKEIRILADNALVIAPPSQHVATRDHYRFLDWYSPKTIPLPEIAPPWLLDLPRLSTPKLAPEHTRHTTNWCRSIKNPGNGYDRDSVLCAIDDKLAVAKSLGLATKSNHPNANGWVQCWVPGREDPARSKSPSGSFQVESGILQDKTTGESMTLFDIGVATGRFDSWYACKNYLGDIYLRGK